MKSDLSFLGNRVANATHFGQVFRNCESYYSQLRIILFAIYLRFCISYLKFAWKKANFVLKRSAETKKGLGESI